MKKLFVILSIVMCAAAAYGEAFAAGGEPYIEISESGLYPPPLPNIRITAPLDFCGEPVPLKDTGVREQLEKEILLALENRAQVILWLKRSGRYMPHIEKILRENRMPDDLKYIAIVESSLLPHIGSSKGAVGYWQFIRPTGLRYGLQIDGDKDERRNFFTATRAAAQYLKKIHGDFGRWTLAAAAYNMGEQGLRRRIGEQKTSEYYYLYLPMETQRYIFKILAAKLILSDARKFGFNLTQKDLYKPLSFDRVQVNLSGSVPVQTVAEAAETYFKTIKDMNPEIRGSNLSAGTHSILVPKGKGKNFQSRFNTLLSRYRPPVTPKTKATSRKQIVHVVRRGEFLSKIANKYSVSVSDIRRWNRLRKKQDIHPGQHLVIVKN